MKGLFISLWGGLLRIPRFVYSQVVSLYFAFLLILLAGLIACQRKVVRRLASRYPEMFDIEDDSNSQTPLSLSSTKSTVLNESK